ncbi:MAG: thiamine pyrophosphate-dependent enzyme [Methanomicrobiales archaeon]|nr:thiamine pyrophosphate-dependent enzyme [Methanomicrobiales archaeon]
MNGEKAIAAALRICADRFYGVPGYPVNGLIELLDAEPVINEKVALEYALGDSLAERRAAVIMKNVGLNACTDPLVHATSMGLVSGVVIVSGDDPGAKGTTVAEDSRYFGELAQVPVLEPDRETCGSSVASAFEASESFSRVAILRLTPPLLESEVPDSSCTRQEQRGSRADPNLTMRGRAERADLLLQELFQWSQLSRLNRIRGGSIGVGPAHGTSHLITVYPPPPLPHGVVINEYGRPFVREHLTLEPPKLRKLPETFASRGYCRTICPSCPYRALFRMMREKGLVAICDMGCAILAANPPFGCGVCGYGLGSSIAVAARSTRVALVGDYALLHSGINALIDVYEKRLPLLCIVMKNMRMGMTGGHRVFDPLKYVSWAEPEVHKAEDTRSLEKALRMTGEPHLLVVEGVCPEGEEHERVEC